MTLMQTAPASFGSDDKPPTLVLVHGFLDQGSTWSFLVATPTLAGLKSVAPDLRGAGRSSQSTGPFSLGQAVEDIVQCIDRIAGPVVLVGHSMGAQIAELAAVRRMSRICGLVLITPTPLVGNELSPEVRTFLRGCGGDVEAQRQIRENFSRVGGKFDPASLDPLRVMQSSAVEGYYDAFTAGDDSGRRPSLYLGPVLILAAASDPVISMPLVESIRSERFPASALVTIEESGHWPHVEQSGVVGELIARFLGVHSWGCR